MADFVKLSIFGTVSPSFEAAQQTDPLRRKRSSHEVAADRQVFEVTTRYVDLQPVGMGAFGLVWYVFFRSSRPRDYLSCTRACVGGL